MVRSACQAIPVLSLLVVTADTQQPIGVLFAGSLDGTTTFGGFQFRLSGINSDCKGIVKILLTRKSIKMESDIEKLKSLLCETNQFPLNQKFPDDSKCRYF